MYNFPEQLALLQKLGVNWIRVYKISNEKTFPGDKLVGGVELPVQNDQGLIVSYDAKLKTTFVLAVEVKHNVDLLMVWTEGSDRRIRILRGETPDDTRTAFYAKRIPTDKTLCGEYVTKSNDRQGNSVWAISTADSRLRMWEIAIVTVVVGGRSQYFISLQEVYTAAMFTANGDIYVPEEEFPGYKDWESLQVLLNTRTDPFFLRPLSEYQKQAEKINEAEVVNGNQARILWFNQARGFGFAEIPGEEQNPIFHRTSVEDQIFPAFKPGQIIKYARIERTPKGVQLRGVSEV
ncbi:MAG: cold shock domain-containing protein [Candidatus Yanofskybacteria bacterium]|nr:cold shock domain-containing protein [Candidatus Yanofskybacteria bacterium]